MTKRAARAHLAPALLGANKAPGRMPAQPFIAPLVACHGLAYWLGFRAGWLPARLDKLLR
ncbi:MAG: hypothetical protein QM742_18925 [Aquabacterium sp.]